jgi:hypothetical protein
MTLFGAHHAVRGSIEEVAHMVEHYFTSRGLDPHKQEIDGAEGAGWWLNEGSARIYIFIQEAPGGNVLRISSPIVHLPRERLEDFYRHLLDINANLTCCALATAEDAVLVVTQRHTMQLDQGELEDLIWNVAYVADLLDDRLASDFNTRRYQS